MITQYNIPPLVRPQRRYVPCSHKSPVLCRRIISGVTHFWEYCTDCGKELRRLKHADVTAGQKQAAIAFTVDLCQSWRAKKRNDSTYEAQYEAYRKAWDAWYQGYLGSEVWAGKRAAVMQRTRNTCECCGTERAVNVHHLTYDSVGCEPLWDLQAVCRGCHKWVHGRTEATEVLSSSTGDNLDLSEAIESVPSYVVDVMALKDGINTDEQDQEDPSGADHVPGETQAREWLVSQVSMLYVPLTNGVGAPDVSQGIHGWNFQPVQSLEELITQLCDGMENAWTNHASRADGEYVFEPPDWEEAVRTALAEDKQAVKCLHIMNWYGDL